MAESDRDPRDVDSLLHEAGSHWRTRQVFEAVQIVPHSPSRSRTPVSGILSPAIGLITTLAIGVAILALGAGRFGGVGDDLATSGPVASVPVTTGPSSALSSAEEEAAWLLLVEMVNTDPSNFGLPYIDGAGAMVVQYVNEDARAAVEAQMNRGLLIRWQMVEYSQIELRRIRSEISALRLEGVFSVSSGTSRNRVIVKVGPSGSVDKVAAALGKYGAAVVVESSDDLPLVIPVMPTTGP